MKHLKRFIEGAFYTYFLLLVATIVLVIVVAVHKFPAEFLAVGVGFLLFVAISYGIGFIKERRSK